MSKKYFFQPFVMILALILVTVLIGLRPATPARAAAVKIMALGDSITGSPGCWRALLWNRLIANGYTNFQPVGTLPPAGCPNDNSFHEGHGGYLATGIANQDQLPPWLAATNPDIVLMHLGTNDSFNAANTVDMILAAYTKMVGQMRANNPNMKILVAQIIPLYTATTQCTDCYQRVIALNNAIPAWAAGLSTAQSPIVVVDQWTGFNTTTDTGDGIHPNDAGNQKMSDKWYPALSALLSPGGATATLTRTPTVGASITPGGPTATRTPTQTVGASNTPSGPTNTPASGSLIVQINKGNGIDNTQETGFNFLLKNTGASAVSNLSTRVYFDTDGSNAGSGYVLEKYYDQSGVATYSGPTLACGSTYYFTVTYGTASLAAGGQWEIQTALHLSSWASTYSGANDFYHGGYAVGALPVSYTTTANIPAYTSGSLTSGSTPNCGGPTSTTAPVATATRTPTQTVGASNTPTGPTNTPVPPTATRTNTPIGPTATRTNTLVPLTATRTPTQTVGASNTPVPPTATPGGSDPCASPTVITGGGSFAITTSATCFKYVNAANKWGGMFTVMNGSSSAANTLKWYGGRSETVTACINDSQVLSGNGAQLNNFTVAKDSTGAMYLTVTGSAANTISLSIQNWQNGTGCSAVPTPHP